MHPPGWEGHVSLNTHQSSRDQKEMSEPLADELLILPDGNKISIGKEKFQSTEWLRINLPPATLLV